MNTPQIETWTGDFGREYTDRNTLTVAELDKLYLDYYGITRSLLNERFCQAHLKARASWRLVAMWVISS